MERDPTETAYDLFTHIACATMMAAPDGDRGIDFFRDALLTIACMCASGVAGLLTDRDAAMGIITPMIANAPPLDVLEVIRINTHGAKHER
jgi:hypothetical protein